MGRTRVHLTWDGVKFPVAGYLVERKAEDAERWALLTATVVPEPRFDDPIGLHTQGEFHYRVTAVAFDNQQSKPSREVKSGSSGYRVAQTRRASPLLTAVTARSP